MSVTRAQPTVGQRRVSVIPRRCGPISGAQLVDRDLLARVSVSTHALERFAERAGVPAGARAELEPLIRDLLEQEGLVVIKPPRWARLRRPSAYAQTPLYLQAGFWMLFVCKPDPRSGPSHWTITTVVTEDPTWTWPAAVSARRIGTPPPPDGAPPAPEPITLSSSVALALARTRSPVRLPRVISTVHEARKQASARRHAIALQQWRREHRSYERARHQAHARHLRRHGFVT